MSDIVERLRAEYKAITWRATHTMRDAADEIERLREEVEQYRGASRNPEDVRRLAEAQEQNKYLLEVANSLAPRIKETEARLAEAEAQLAEANEIIRGWLKDWIERH